MEFKDRLHSIFDNISTVDMLSESQMRQIGRKFISAQDLDAVLNNAGIDYVLIGAHAIGKLTGEPRATQDVDIIIHDGDFSRAIKAILGQYPSLYADGSRIKDGDDNVVVDILTDKNPLFRYVMSSGQIPDAETILVMKFVSGTSPLRRKDKRFQDKADFINVAMKSDIDERKVLEILKKVDPEYVVHMDEIMTWLGEARD